MTQRCEKTYDNGKRCEFHNGHQGDCGPYQMTEHPRHSRGMHVQNDPDLIGPDSFGGSDEGSHYMAQTSAKKLIEEGQQRRHGTSQLVARGGVIRQTRTYAILEVSKATYDEIAGKLRAAGYGQAFDNDFTPPIIDMHGIAIGQED